MSKKHKFTPTFIIKRRMLFFANRAMDKSEEQGGWNPDSDEMAMICKYWASEVLRRNPDDKDAKIFLDENSWDKWKTERVN